MAIPPVNLNDTLRFNPHWNWDPVPWWWMKQLDQSVLNQLATIQLEHQRAVLDSQRAMIDKSLAIVKGTK